METHLEHYKKLMTRLNTPWQGEEGNPFLKFTRIRLRSIFYEVLSVDSIELMPLHFFTLMELNCIRIVAKKKRFTEVILPYFTREGFLKDSIIHDSQTNARYREKLGYISRYLENRSIKVVLKSKFMKAQFHKIMKGVLLKIEFFEHQRRRKNTTKSIIEITRSWIRKNKLSRYFNWCIKTGAKFSNRCEADFNPLYNLQNSIEFELNRDENKAKVQKRG